MNHRVIKSLTILIIFLNACSSNRGDQYISTEIDWNTHTNSNKSTLIISNLPIGGRSDLFGDGALLLAKTDTSTSFWKTTAFDSLGTWISTPISSDFASIKIDWVIYGKQQDFKSDWDKFDGNPLISHSDFIHNSPYTLVLPKEYGDKPADQSIVKGAGDYESKWLLFFNVGGWAVKGWAMAVADDLSPLKEGINPFTLADPYPLTKATGGYNAPNDWILADSIWYAPDESRDHKSRMWTSTNLSEWTLRGTIDGINGHDPGMVYDGDFFYLFNESENDITFVRASDPLGKWELPDSSRSEIALQVGDHTGDADVMFFNNRWHMFIDDGIHLKYKISYAHTTAEEFPYGWQLVPEIFGPHSPEENQLWDDDNESGNNFGTGDADIVLDNTTLYMTYETPIGIAWKDLDVLEDNEQLLKARLLFPNQSTTEWMQIPVGNSTISLTSFKNLANTRFDSFQLELELNTQNTSETPLIKSITIQ